LSYWLVISLQDTVYLKTGYLIENFVNDWYFKVHESVLTGWRLYSFCCLDCPLEFCSFCFSTNSLI